MSLNFVRPNRVLSILNELQKTKKALNRFEKEEDMENFLKKNEEKYDIKNKIDLIINNFEENTLFLYSNKNSEKLFEFLNKSTISYCLSEELIYKMYLYFYGYVEETRLKKMLFKYSGNKLKNINLREFVEKNVKNLFEKECKFPKVLNGEYKSLEEIATLIENDTNLLKFFKNWEDNLLKYLLNLEENTLKKIIEKKLKKVNKKINEFFSINKKIKIKNITINYQYIKEKYYKIIKIKLEKEDLLVYIKEVNGKTEKGFYYLKKDSKNISNLGKKILTEFDLIDELKDNYSLNKIYLFKQKIKKILKKDSII